MGAHGALRQPLPLPPGVGGLCLAGSVPAPWSIPGQAVSRLLWGFASTLGLPVHHQLPVFTQTHVH